MASARIRAAAVAALASWISCAPLGLCLRASAEAPATATPEPARHACCPQPALGLTAAPEQCAVRSSTPTPAATPLSLAQPAAMVIRARLEGAALAGPVTPLRAFSPLAVVLRI